MNGLSSGAHASCKRVIRLRAACCIGVFCLRCNFVITTGVFFVFVCTANGRGRGEEETAAGAQQNSGDQVSAEKTRKDYESDASEYLCLLHCAFNII